MSLDFHINPPVCPHCRNAPEGESFNITHNLGKMASEAGLYEVLWRPEEQGYVFAKDILPQLRKGYIELSTNRKKYEQFNSPNGWGLYEHLLGFTSVVLRVCEEHPDWTIYACR